MRMDLSFAGVAPEGGTLRADITRREGVSQGRRTMREDGSGSHLGAAERYKRRKYAGRYPPPQLLEGFAVDSYGGVGPGAGAVMRMLAAVGAQLTGRAASELLRELEWTVGFVLVRFGAYLEQVAAQRARVTVWYPKVRAAYYANGELRVTDYGRARGGMAAYVARVHAARALASGDPGGGRLGTGLGPQGAPKGTTVSGFGSTV